MKQTRNRPHVGRRRRDDDLDLLAKQWAHTRRELAGLTTPVLSRSYIGAVRCPLGRRNLNGGHGDRQREQSLPEVYTGDALRLNCAFKRLPPDLAAVFEVHYCAPLPCDERAALLAMSSRCYFNHLAAARAFVRGYLVGNIEMRAGSL